MLHKYVYGPLPPVGLAVKVAVSPVHITAPGTVAIVIEGESNSSKSIPLDSADIHPLASVTVALYSPAADAVYW